MKTISTFLQAGYCHITPGHSVSCLFEGGNEPSVAFMASNHGLHYLSQYLKDLKEEIPECFDKESCMIPTSNGWFYQGQAALDRINKEMAAFDNGTHPSMHD